MRNLFVIAAFAVIAAAACSPAKPPTAPVGQAKAAAAETSRLTTYLDAEFEKELAMNPERATQLGRKDNYDKLNDYSEAQQDKMLDWRRKSVADMKAQFDRTKLNPDGQMNYDIWVMELERAERAQKYRRQAYVFGRSATHSEKPSFLISFHRVSEVADMEAYNSRLSQLGRVMDQSVEKAKAAAAEKIRMPKFQYERVIAESQKLISGQPFDSKKSPPSALWADATAKIDKLVKDGKATPDQAKALTEGARKAMLEGMKPGYERLIAWAKTDSVNAPSGKVGAVTLPDGLNWYAEALYDQTTTDMTADEIHKLGLSEVDRIHGEMDKLAKSAGFKDRAAFLADRAKKTDLALPPTDAGRAEYLKLANAAVKAARAKVPDFFGNLPKYDMVVEREPSYSEIPGGAAHASRATPDGSKPGVVYVHLLTPTGFLKQEIQDLMCHEGVPGHLLQGDIMVRQTGVPKLRTAYSYAAYSEGWGLYSEGLCKEMGVYPDVYADYARLDGELWRAVRLVVDTGLHAMGWTEEEAVAYAKANTSEPDSKIHAEVRRFLINPGQACAYKIGQLTILRLRAKAQSELGPKFDIKAFHDMVVGAGSLPLSVFETRVTAWIAGQKEAVSGPAKS